MIISEFYHFKHGCSLVVGLSIGWVQLNRLKHNHHIWSVWVQVEYTNQLRSEKKKINVQFDNTTRNPSFFSGLIESVGVLARNNNALFALDT